jgi:5-oxoprolinase (ATP-hydrolysing)
VEPSDLATSLPEHVVIDRTDNKQARKEVNTTDLDQVDPVQLSVYGHRLMGIAEQVSYLAVMPALTYLDGKHLA